MRLLSFLLSLLIINSSLFAVDDAACSTTTYFQDTTTATGTVTFKKRCLPNKEGDLKVDLNIRGGIYQIGNQVLCAMDEDISTSECIDPHTKAENTSNVDSGGCANNFWTNDGCQNNDFSGGPDNEYLNLADYDDNTSNSSDYNFTATQSSSTDSSTMARLSLNSGDEILWARLYWTGRLASSADYGTVDEVLLRSPTTNGYETITCSAYGESGDNYSCSADVTAKVTESGEYWIGNVKAEVENSGGFAAWNLVIVYANLKAPYQNINIYEGFGVFSNSSLTVNIDGFLTPESDPFESSLYLFSGESDNGYGDYISLTDKTGGVAGTHVVYNPNNQSFSDLLNASISVYGVNNTDRLPNYTNALGIDIDTLYAHSDANGTRIIENNQTSTTLTFTSTGDRLYTPVIGFTTELYVPNLCYDYGYSQDSHSFTEENNGSADPRIVGTVVPDKNVTLSVTIHNLEEGSDILNTRFYLNDLNTSQLTITDNVLATDSGNLLYLPITSTDLNATAGDLNFALDPTMPSAEGIFMEITLLPQQAELDAPLDMTVSFDLIANGETINYSDFQLNQDIPICAPSGAYNPAYGIYSVVDQNINGTITEGANNLKYNLFTQVANRPIQAKVVAFDTNNTHTVIRSNDFMAVEMFDGNTFHDTNKSCMDPKAKISTTEWFQFGESNTTVTDMNLSLPSSFYNVARENTGFRLWYLRDRESGNRIFIPTASGTLPNVDVDSNISSTSPCIHPYGINLNNSVGDADACGDKLDLNLAQQTSCASCLFGYTANVVCSRDNFSIRPESFDIKIYDIDHTKTPGSLDRNNSAIYISDKTPQLAAGYNYKFDITATSHTANDPTPGYTRNFITADKENNASFVWSPDPLKDVSGCNDPTTLHPDFYIANGFISDNSYNQERNLTNVGQYTFSMIDTTWTIVDQQPPHHFDSLGVILPHFDVGSINDCLLNSNKVPIATEPLNNGNIGCHIESTHLNDDDHSFDTSDYNMTFAPYRFSMDSMNATFGKTSTPIANGSFLYMSDLNKSTEMALHFEGDFRPVGEGDNTLSNFVHNCYAEDININFDHNASPESPSLPSFQYAYRDNYTAHNLGAWDVNVTGSLIVTIPSSYFEKADLGSIPNFNLHFNYERNSSSPKEILRLQVGDLNTTCTTQANCQSIANLLSDHNATGILPANADMIFAYGRVHAPRYRINGPLANVNIYYEVFCQTSNCQAYGLTKESVDDVFWYINSNHDNELLLGDATNSPFISSVGHINFTYPPLTFVGIGTKLISATYDEGNRYPFKSKITMTPDSWLIFNSYDENATNDYFTIEYYNTNSDWSGAVNNASTVDTNASQTTNRRINW